MKQIKVVNTKLNYAELVMNYLILISVFGGGNNTGKILKRFNESICENSLRVIFLFYGPGREKIFRFVGTHGIYQIFCLR